VRFTSSLRSWKSGHADADGFKRASHDRHEAGGDGGGLMAASGRRCIGATATSTSKAASARSSQDSTRPLSSAFVPIQSMLGWLQAVANNQPVALSSA
jgi:hypothetical protein